MAVTAERGAYISMMADIRKELELTSRQWIPMQPQGRQLLDTAAEAAVAAVAARMRQIYDPMV
jgi:hypothetical protein